MRLIDDFLNRITMYRLVLYMLIVTLAVAMGLGFLGKLAFNGWAILWCTLFLTAVSYITNKVFALVFEAPTNTESVYITALILALIITPANSFHGFVFLGWAAVLAQASKYILAVGKKHIFNPAAIAVVITAFGIGQSASWWVGNLSLAPIVAAGGLLVARKIRREDMVWYFLLGAAVTILAFTVARGNNVFSAMNTLLFHSSLLFFAFVMLTEPLTTPPTARGQIIYALLVGVLFAPQIHIGSIYSTPELALVVGNMFSFAVSPKIKMVLTAKERKEIAPGMYDFVFGIKRKINYKPGQYMEFTLAHPKTDDRGNRRYFTLASSPTEDTLRIGVKFYNPSSSFKKEMLGLDQHVPIVAAQLAGDFTLPEDTSLKLAFIAGGIGVTPFRSMMKYLTDTNQKRDVVLMYANKTAEEIVYKEVFDAAKAAIGAKTVYTITDAAKAPPGWTGEVGRIDAAMIQRQIPDYRERTFYVSGPHAMVTAYEETLQSLGVPRKQVVTDYFPGFA